MLFFFKKRFVSTSLAVFLKYEEINQIKTKQKERKEVEIWQSEAQSPNGTKFGMDLVAVSAAWLDALRSNLARLCWLCQSFVLWTKYMLPHALIHCVITLGMNTLTHLISYYQFSNALSANGMEAACLINLDRLRVSTSTFRPFSFRVFDYYYT